MSTTQFENPIDGAHRERQRGHIAAPLAAGSRGGAFADPPCAWSAGCRIAGRLLGGNPERLLHFPAGVPFQHRLLPQMGELLDVLITELQIALGTRQVGPLVGRQATQVLFDLRANLLNAVGAELMIAGDVAIGAPINDGLAINRQVALSRSTEWARFHS